MSGRLLITIYEGQNLSFLFWLSLFKFEKHFAVFRKVPAKTRLFFFFSQQWQETSSKPPQATEILTIFCLLCISSQGRQHDGTTAAPFGFHHQYVTHRCHPRKTRHSTQTHTRAHARTYDICEQKQAVRTEAWQTYVGCCDTLPHYFFPGCF